MTKVSGEVQEVVQTTGYVYQAILALWAMTPIELKMYIAMMFTISILLQYVKKSFLTQYSKKERIQKLWAISFPIAIALSVGGAYLYGNKVHMGYFILTGLTVSTVSMGAHRVVVDYVWPAIKTVIDAIWSRVMLLIRGKPSNG